MKFSIIIPVYNVAQYLRDCLDTIFGQKYEDWECVCVDDGSSDGSSEILDEYAGRDKRIRVFHRQNAGVSVARNVALEVARGEWIVFVDADDILRRECLSVLAAVVERCPELDAVSYGYKSFPDGDLASLHWDEPAGGEWTPTCRPITCPQLGYNVWRVAMKRSLVAGIRFKPYVVGEDILFLYSCAVKARQTLAMDCALYGYRLRSGSVMLSEMTTRKFLDHLGYHLELFGVLRDFPDRFDGAYVRICLNRYLEGSMRDLSNLKETRNGLLWKSWRAGLGLASECGPVSAFQRMRIRILSAVECIVVDWLLLNFPIFLKTWFYRLHRRR